MSATDLSVAIRTWWWRGRGDGRNNYPTSNDKEPITKRGMVREFSSVTYRPAGLRPLIGRRLLSLHGVGVNHCGGRLCLRATGVLRTYCNACARLHRRPNFRRDASRIFLILRLSVAVAAAVQDSTAHTIRWLPAIPSICALRYTGPTDFRARRI